MIKGFYKHLYCDFLKCNKNVNKVLSHIVAHQWFRTDPEEIRFIEKYKIDE